MNNRIDISYWVEAKATSAVRRFYPSAVAKELSIPINIVFEKLVDMVRDGKLDLLWEVICPECYRACSIDTSQDAKLNLECECVAGHTFVVGIDNIVPSFQITNNYISKARENSKKKEQSLRLMPV